MGFLSKSGLIYFPMNKSVGPITQASVNLPRHKVQSISLLNSPFVHHLLFVLTGTASVLVLLIAHLGHYNHLQLISLAPFLNLIQKLQPAPHLI